MLIGSKIKELRKTRKMTLTELSQASGVQLATLSRIENLKMTGTLDSHMNIAKALGVGITELYSNIVQEDKKIEVQAAGKSTDIFVHRHKSSYEILTAKVLTKKMMPVLLRVEPSGKTDLEQNAPGTEKFVFVLEGELEIKIGDDTYSLSKHNTLYFDASAPHFFVNQGKTPVRAISVSTPVAL